MAEEPRDIKTSGIVRRAPIAPSAKPKQEESPKPTIRLTLAQFFREFIVNNKTFLEIHLVEKSQPYLLLVLWMFGMANIIRLIEIREKLFEIIGISGKIIPENWIILWCIIIGAGLLFGIIGYWIGGFLYHLRVIFSKGTPDFRLSRLIYLYSGIPLFFFTILIEIIAAIKYGSSYFEAAQSAVFIISMMTLLVTGVFFTLHLSFRAVRQVYRTRKDLSIIFFMIIPIVYHLVMLSPNTYVSLWMHTKAVNYKKHGIEMLDKRDFNQAETLLKKALKSFDVNDKDDLGDIYHYLGIISEKKGDTQDAIGNYQRAIGKYKADSADYILMRASINVLQNELPEAIRNLETVLQLEPGNFHANKKLGLIYLGDMDNALSDYQKALVYNEKAYALQVNNDTAYNVARNYYFLQRENDALPLFSSLLNTDRDNAYVRYYLGMINYNQGNLKKAKSFMLDAVTIDESIVDNFEIINRIINVPEEKKTGPDDEQNE